MAVTVDGRLNGCARAKGTRSNIEALRDNYMNLSCPIVWSDPWAGRNALS